MSSHKLLTAWLTGRDTGLSSKAIAAHMTGVERRHADSPLDPDDLGRCLRLLELFPEWKSRMSEMARYGGEWIGLAAHWDEIAALMEEEVGINWSKGRAAKRTYAAMRKYRDEGLKADPNIEVFYGSDGSILGWQTKEAAA